MVRFVRGDSAANAGFRQKFFDGIYRFHRIGKDTRGDAGLFYEAIFETGGLARI
jgi:hypothetical protein